MKTAIQFKSKGQTIQGNFYTAHNVISPAPTILLLPGLPGNEEDVLGLGEGLSKNGLNALMFNYRGVFRSEGKYSIENTQKDIKAAFEFICSEITIKKFQLDPDKLVLGGYSFGGGMALNYASRNLEVENVFSIGGTNHGEFGREYQKNKSYSNLIDDFFEDIKFPQGPIKFSGKTAIREELIPNIDKYDLLLKIDKFLNKNILLIAGWDDSDILLEKHILPFYRAMKNAGSDTIAIHSFQDNHSFEKCRPELAQTTQKWVKSLFG